jgi:hypothetical protein
MAKKKRKNLQNLIQKRQQLQQITLGTNEAEPVINSTSSPEIVPAINPAPVDVAATQTVIARSTVPGIGRTLVSVAIVIVLLSAAVIFNEKSPILGNIGSWLYTAAQLGKS